MAARRRLDAELVRRNLAPSRDAAKRLIESGRVLVGGAPTLKAAYQVDPAQDVKVSGPRPRFVSRAGEKLAGALDRFPVDPSGRHCVDIGSSTGGFTDCLLQRGAASVVAIDVGTHQLHEKLRSDGRVQVREKTDFRTVKPRQFPNGISLAVGDVSFISLRLLLPALAGLDPTDSLLLIKPQFEAGRQEASKSNGIIIDPEIWRRTLAEVLGVGAELGFILGGLMVSPITGRAGNVEFIAHLLRDFAGEGIAALDIGQAIDSAVGEASLEETSINADRENEPS
ncbi:MAG: TlyA family RNA methyltransferase [Acidimicrobiales bacterium]|nr:TlyA family RNA methyltransferase [Acidimicrobiales bacterium]